MGLCLSGIESSQRDLFHEELDQESSYCISEGEGQGTEHTRGSNVNVRRVDEHSGGVQKEARNGGRDQSPIYH